MPQYPFQQYNNGFYPTMGGYNPYGQGFQPWMLPGNSPYGFPNQPRQIQNPVGGATASQLPIDPTVPGGATLDGLSQQDALGTMLPTTTTNKSVTDFTQQFANPLSNLKVDSNQTIEGGASVEPFQFKNPMFNPWMNNQFNPLGGGNVPFQGTTPFYAQALGRSIGYNPDLLRQAGVQEKAVRGATGTNILRGIFGGLGVGLSTTKDILAGMGAQRRADFVAMRNAQMMRQNQFNQYNMGSEDLFNNMYPYWYGTGYKDGGEVRSYKDGGQIPMEKLLSGRLTTGVDGEDNPQVNAEVEKGEYLIFPDGVVSKVEGDKHSQGGEQMTLPDKTRIISDNVKIGGEQAKLFKKLGLGVKAGNTFADVMDKFEKKFGIEDLHKEQEEYIAKLEKNAEVKDENTKGLNEEFISGKINEIEQQKQQLAGLELFFADLVYTGQEEKKEDQPAPSSNKTSNSSSNKEDDSLGFSDDHINFTSGNIKIQIPVFFRDGGVFTSQEYVPHFKTWAQQNGFKNMREATDRLRSFKEGGEKKDLPKYAEAGQVNFEYVKRNGDGTVTIIEKKGDAPKKLTEQQYKKQYDVESWNKLVSSGAPSHESNPIYTEDLRVHQSRSNVTTGGSTVTGYGTVKDEPTLLARLSDLYKQFPGLVRNTFDVKVDGSGNVISVGKFDDAAVESFQRGVHNTLTENLGRAKSSGISDDEVKAMEQFITDNNFLETIPKGASQADLIRGFDKKFGNFTSTRTNIAYPFASPEDLTKLQGLGIRTTGDLRDAVAEGTIKMEDLSPLTQERLGRFGDISTVENEGFVISSINPDIKIPEVEAQAEAKTAFGPTPVGGYGQAVAPYTFINQDPLPPDALASHFYNITNLPRVTPMKFSPEEAIVEGNRLERQAFDQIGQNVGSQQGANIANTIAQIGQGANKAVTETNRLNATLAQQAQGINMNAAVQEAQLNDMQLERADRLNLTALDTHQQNIRNYFKTLQDNRVQASKDAQSLAVLQSVYSNYGFDPYLGIVHTRGEALPPILTTPALDAWNLTLAGQQTT